MAISPLNDPEEVPDLDGIEIIDTSGNGGYFLDNKKGNILEIS